MQRLLLQISRLCWNHHTAVLAAVSFFTVVLGISAALTLRLATDVADYLVRKGVPFRDAHQAVAELVRYAQMEGKALSELSLEEYRRFSAAFEEDVLALDLRSAIEARDAPGGTSPRRVEAALKRARERLRSVPPREPANQ